MTVYELLKCYNSESPTQEIVIKTWPNEVIQVIRESQYYSNTTGEAAKEIDEEYKSLPVLMWEYQNGKIEIIVDKAEKPKKKKTEVDEIVQLEGQISIEDLGI